jgi:hypothetical protein
MQLKVKSSIKDIREMYNTRLILVFDIYAQNYKLEDNYG